MEFSSSIEGQNDPLDKTTTFDCASRLLEGYVQDPQVLSANLFKAFNNIDEATTVATQVATSVLCIVPSVLCCV